jgi:hypothetical protein
MELKRVWLRQAHILYAASFSSCTRLLLLRMHTTVTAGASLRNNFAFAQSSRFPYCKPGKGPPSHRFCLSIFLSDDGTHVSQTVALMNAAYTIRSPKMGDRRRVTGEERFSSKDFS